MHVLELPEPTEIEKQHSHQLSELIKHKITESGGWISYDQYMQLALYAPGQGYYSAGVQKFGEQGDFITSPEIGSLFAQTIARPVAKLLREISNAKVIEFGAGSGRLATDLLLELEKLQQLPEAYLIVELSADLQQRQREALKKQVPHLLERVHWLSSLPDHSINAVVLANEVLDAMPVKRFAIRQDALLELGVECAADELQLSYQAAGKSLQEQINKLEINTSESANEYCSEINLNIKPWIKALVENIHQGAVYLFDYGYTRAEYYSAERYMGTSIGYYRHRSLDAPLWFPGLQDLTAFVDFTEVAESAHENGLDVDGFTSQGNFLINCGISEIVEQTDTKTKSEYLQLIQQMKTLSLPGEMGERFKVIGMSRGLDKNIPGFEQRDLRYSL